MTLLYLLMLYFAIVIGIFAFFAYIHTSRQRSVVTSKTHKTMSSASQCSKASCGASDPVSDPAYNMENVVKQSILLEEHLAEKNKYCKDCVSKHFLHIIGLVEEAQMLAGESCNEYPLLEESLPFYTSSFHHWKANRDDHQVHLELVTSLRKWRKDLIRLYVLT